MPIVAVDGPSVVNDTLDGGTGTDTASYSASLTAVLASLASLSSMGEGSDTFVVGVEEPARLF